MTRGEILFYFYFIAGGHLGGLMEFFFGNEQTKEKKRGDALGKLKVADK